jgi:hypothetical protein
LRVGYGGRTLIGPIGVNELYDLAAQPPRKLYDIYGPVVLHPGSGRVAWSNQTEIEIGAVGPLLAQPAADRNTQFEKVTVLDFDGLKETIFCSVDGRRGSLSPLAFSPEGRYLAVRHSTTESGWSWPARALWGEQRIQLYDAVSGLRHAWFRGGSCVRFAPDGTSLITLGDGPIRLYRLPARPWLVIVFGGAAIAALLVF